MPFSWVLPPLGGGSTATIEQWYRAAGETVGAHEPLVLLRTERAAYVLPAPVAGEINTLLAVAGSTVAVGQVLAEIATGEAAPAPASTLSRIRSTPLARSMAALHRIDLRTITGSGRGGRIIRADLLRHGGFDTGPRIVSTQAAPQVAPAPLASPSPLATPPFLPAASGQLAETPGAEAQEEQRGIAPRGVTAVPQVVAMEAPLAISVMEVMLDRALAVGQREASHHRYVRITPTLCVAHAVGMELLHHRLLNARWLEDEIVLRGRVNVAVVHDGQHVVIRDAPERSLVGLARSVREADAAGEGAFTIRQSDGHWSEVPLLPGHAATLSVGTPTKQAVVVSGSQGDRVEIRVVARLALCYDARILVQPEVDAFLLAVKRRIEALQ